ncbi:MAG: translation initiation factor IF-3 [Phycisphaerae bacterium]|nr:translation initiation factor IF-3 [Phycisphaerae bacterium]
MNRNVIGKENPLEKNLRVNEQIRISPIRLIDENEGQIGIIEVRDALHRAREAGLDLVEVSPMSRPPVCRIMDYGKWKYAQRKKEQKSKAARKETELKEIRIKTPKIGDHDLEIKIGHAREFISRGDRVQFTLRFRGRELAHMDEGYRIFQHIREVLSDVAKVDQAPRAEGKRIAMVLTPGAAPAGSTSSVGAPAAMGGGRPAPRPASAGVAPRPAVSAPAQPAPVSPAPEKPAE